MAPTYKQHLIAHYLVNVAERIHHSDSSADDLLNWLVHRDNRPPFEDRRLLSRLKKTGVDFSSWRGMTKKLWRSVRTLLRDECSATAHVAPDNLAQRLRLLGEKTALETVDIAILELKLRCETDPVFGSMIDGIFMQARYRLGSTGIPSWTFATVLGIPENSIHNRLAPDAPLIRSGLLVVGRNGHVDLLHRLKRLSVSTDHDITDVTRLLLHPVEMSELEWADFDHIADGRDHIERLIQGALKSGTAGVNVLLHGPPGTGKTEFCKVLAERIGVTLFSIGESDEEGNEPHGRERLHDFRLGQRLLSKNRRSLVLFDEMDDLLCSFGGGMPFFGPGPFGGTRDVHSRVFMHRLLESTPVPTIWTINDARSVSSAILRRMMFAMELRPPTATMRSRIWARQLEHHKIETGPDDSGALAREFNATPGVAAGVTAAAQLTGGGIDAVRHGIRGLSRVLSCKAHSTGTPARFDPLLIRADSDPVELSERLLQSGQQRFSMCLHGPPGTGKSAFVRYLAERLGLEVMQKRASDLVSMWVGGTEQNIATAFAEAHDNHAFLVFDEADSLLSDRRNSVRSWEVSQVNEMLTWMENHPLPFACTTNYRENLDSAALRRFVFKIELGYLAPSQVAAAFHTYFSLPAPKDIGELTTLTPGDFATVYRKADILGRLDEPRALITMLQEECEAKPDQTRPVGFRARNTTTIEN